ncbi:hypothetical protein Desor_5307 [Desulfosporosinus orientis DSM 765]|uniref:SLAP domain-containing protein n=1 Tax=Desulfosporosinus orientis (strain ATCC 19365 / DSM 765 / NCIMB 8382 / VKM B-1628 / Singapore I) TaxID=768706 RepID=G7WC68_DESOD|nr:SLAP domain-containing protein [Desulfosporosinus orientis]AET70686.1 hypothetical protein Desor_5307 [Desulfosporosinus orientis DSM 765]
MILNFPKIFKGKELDVELSDNNVALGDSTNELTEEEQSLVINDRVTIHFTSVSPAQGALLVGFFIANGYSQKVKFKKVPLVLLDSDRRVLAQQSFSGEVIGEVIGGSTKACVVRFLPENIYTKEIPEDCQICFDVRSKIPQNVKIQYQTLPDKLSEKQKQELEQVLAKLPPMKKGEANFSPLCATETPEGNLLATVIIRNATNMPLSFEQIPLALIDANGVVAAQGIFDVKTLTIEPYKAILWTFNFETVKQDKIDISSWHIQVLHDMPSQ